MATAEFERLRQAMKAQKPYLLEIEQLVQELQNGVVKLDLRIFQGFVTDVITHSSKRLVFKKQGVDNADKK